jgi:trimeric autotransporter adhesin
MPSFMRRLARYSRTKSLQIRTPEIKVAANRPLAVALEPRLMFDAAAATTLADQLNDMSASPEPTLMSYASDPGPSAIGSTHDVVFIDPRLNDWQTLLSDLPVGAEIFVLDADRDGLAQMAEHLDGRSDIGAIHIIAHGEDATALIGNLRLDLGNVDAHAGDLARIGNALTRNGDILFYGCDIGQGADGAALVERIATLTGADVAASANNTGAAALHGDWVFETMSGTVEARLAVGALAQSAYGDILAITHTVQGTNPFPSLTFGSRMVMGDFDNDGDQDILYQNGNTSGTSISVQLNNGDGTFAAAINKPSGVGAFTSGPFNGIDFTQISNTVFAVDLNGDGRVDLVDNQGGSTTPLVYQNTGSGFTSVTSPFPSQTFAGRIVFGDFNNDGLIDALNQPSNTSGNGVTLYLNTGGFTFSSIAKPNGSAFTSGPFNGIDFTLVTATTVSAVDLNGDGRVDLIDNQGGSTVPRLLTNGGGAGFSVGTSFLPSQTFNGRLVFGDFNSDGYVDVLNQNGNTSGSGYTLYVNNATGGYTFTSIAKTDGANFASGPFNGINFTQLTAGNYFVRDIDKDGDVDIVDSQNTASRYITQNGAPPRITASTPADNSTTFDPAGNIVLTFSENVTVGPGLIKIYRTSDDALIESNFANGVRVTGSGTSTITIDPVGNLVSGTGYYILFDINAFVDADGAALGIASGSARVADTSKTSLNFTTSSNVAPTIGNLASDIVAFTEGGSALKIDFGSNATVTDSDSADFNGGSVTVAITTNKVAGEDLLGIDTTGVISLSAGVSVGSTVSVSGTAIGTITTGGSAGSDIVISLNANANAARVQSLLRELTYRNTNGDNPGTSTRVVSVSVNDGDGGTTAVTSNVTVTAVNDAPTIAAPGSITVSEDVASALTGISIADVDAGGASVTVTLSVGSGTIAATSGGGVTVGGTATARTLTGTVANINAFIAASNVTFTTVLNGTTNVTLTVDVSDGGNTGSGGTQTATQNVTLAVTAVNDAPTISNLAGDSASVFAGGAPVRVDVGTNASVADVDSANFNGGNVTITRTGGTLNGNFTVDGTTVQSGGDAIIAAGETIFVGGVAIGTVSGVTDGQGGNNLIISLTTNATPARVQTLLQNLFFTAPSGVDARTFTATVSDGAGGTSAASAFTVNITTPPSPPVIGNLSGDSVSVNAGAAPVRIDLGQNATVTDADSANFNGGSITITRTGGTLNGNFTVDGTTVQSGVNASVSGGETVYVNGVAIGVVNNTLDGQAGNNFTMALVAAATPARMQIFLQNLFFSAPNGGDARTFAATLTDGAGGTSAAANFTVNVIASPPVITNLNGDVVAYAEGAAAVGLDASANATVTDADSANFNGGELRANISAGGVAAQDVLSVRTVGNVTVAAGTVSVSGTAIGTVTGGTGGAALVIALNANATPARVVEVVQALGYNNTNIDAPTTGARTVQVTIRDAAVGPGETSTIASVTVNVTAVNDAPTITAPGSISVSEDVASALTGISIADVDAGGASVTVTLSVGSGTIAATSGGGVTVGGTATARTLTGTVANINAFIAASNVTFTTVLNGTTNVTLTVDVSDGGNTGSGGTQTATQNVTLAVTAVNDAPTITAPGSISVSEDVASALTGISIADVDAGGASVTVTLSVGSGTIAATSGGGVTVGGTATARTLTGTVANINAFIAASNVTFTTVLNGTTNVTLSVDVSDGGNTGSGGTQTATQNVTLAVTAVNDAPTITAPGSITVNEDLASALTGISIADVDAGGASVTVTLSVGSGTIAATSGGGVTVGGTATARTLTGTVANINAFIAASNVTFTTVLNATSSVTLSVDVSDGGNTGSGGTQTATQNVTLAVTAVNDAPTIAAPGSITVTEDVASALTGISIADVDAGGASVTVTLSVGSGTISATSGGGVTVGGTATARTLTGTVANINAFIAASNVTFTTVLNGTTNVTLTVDVSDGGNTGSGGTQTATQNVTLAVTAVNDAPTITAPGSISVSEDVASALTGISIADVDAGGASVTVTLGLSSVPVNFGILSITPTLGSLTAISGSGVTVGGTPTALTLTGSVADINAFIAASKVTFTTAANEIRGNTLSVTVNDNGNTGTGGLKTATTNVTLAVNAVNDTPVLTVPTTFTVTEDVQTALTGILISDPDKTDFATSENVTLVLEVTSGTLSVPAGNGLFTNAGIMFPTSVSISGSGTNRLVIMGDVGTIPTYFPVGIQFQTAANAVAPVTLNVTLSDNGTAGSGGAKTVTRTSTISVTPVPDAPVVAGPAIPNQPAISGLPFTFIVPAGTFVHPDAGGVITLSAKLADGSPLPGWLTFNPATGTFAGTPPAGASLLISIIATDAGGRTATLPLRIDVANGDTAGNSFNGIVDGDQVQQERLQQLQQDVTPLQQVQRRANAGAERAPDSPQVLSGDKLDMLFSLRPDDPTLIAQVFQGRTDLGDVVPDPFRSSTTRGTSFEPMLVFRNGGWYVLDPSAPGGYRAWGDVASMPGEKNEMNADAGGSMMIEVAATAPSFTRQVDEASRRFDRRTASLDAALSEL